MASAVHVAVWCAVCKGAFTAKYFTRQILALLWGEMFIVKTILSCEYLCMYIYMYIRIEKPLHGLSNRGGGISRVCVGGGVFGKG